ncbi:MAG: hypothetical protein E6Q97_37790 [Desulfurellales bacterium]|nr:MAG: hypothetical protein E6Q97_37790 [Desulfurellales bacterium]
MSHFIEITDIRQDFPHDPQPMNSLDLKATRDRLVECATRMGHDFSNRSASGHTYAGRMGEYAACRMGTDMSGVTIVVRPSQIEIIAIEREYVDANTVDLARFAKAYVRRGVESMRSVIAEAVRLFGAMRDVEVACRL